MTDGTPGEGDGTGDAAAPEAGKSPLKYDVVVVGAGSGGIAAAIQAGRLKVKVALIEETDLIGGQMIAAAVSNMDGGRVLPAGTGIYLELKKKVIAYYGDASRFPPSGKSVHTCYWSNDSICFEPAVGKKLLEEMLAQASVDLFLDAQVVASSTKGNTVTGVRLASGQVFEAGVVIDATEHGDVIPLTGAAFRVGNSLSAAINPAACIQDLTYVAVIKKYPKGLPPGFKITSPPPGYSTLRPAFQAVVTKNGSATPAWPIPYPVNWGFHNGYRGLPDSSNPDSYSALELGKITKTGVNWANDFPGAKSGKNLTVAYLEQPAVRRQTACEAKLVTLSFVYYAQTELGEVLWSVADDQGYDTTYHKQNLCSNIPSALKPLERQMPVMPYVRESRRIVAVKMLTAKQIKRVGTPARAVQNFSSAIAVGDYGTDLHRCSGDASLEADLGETSADASGSGLFQVPMETLIPEVVDGFLAAEKNIGVSRLANGAIRLQPITMATGQAAGVVAALAVQAGVQPRKVRPIDVQEVLVKAGAGVARYHFKDVPLGDPLWPSVQLVAAHEIMVGDGKDTFSPAASLTRAQTASVLARLFELDTTSPPATPTFADVPQSNVHYAAIEALFKAGLTGGCGTNPLVFCPTTPVTRGQLAVFIVKGLGLDPSQAPATPLFTDVLTSHPFFKQIQLVAQKGIMTACSVSPKAFCPDSPITRGAAAAVVARVLVLK